MPTYVTLFRWTQLGIENVKVSPTRLDAARELFRASCPVTGKIDELEQLLDAVSPLRFGDAANPEPVGHVLESIHVGEQAVVFGLG